MAEKPKKIFIVSPAGRLKYPNFHKPRDYKGDGRFKYDGKLVLEGAEGAAFAAKLDELMGEAQKRLRKPKGAAPYTPVFDAEGNPIPGKIEVKYRVNATWPDGTDRRPKQYKGDGTPLETVVPLGGGTRARIRAIAHIREHAGTAGITLQPTQIQILELVRPEESADDFGGFDPVEDAEDFDVDAFEGESSGADF